MVQSQGQSQPAQLLSPGLLSWQEGAFPSPRTHPTTPTEGLCGGPWWRWGFGWKESCSWLMETSWGTSPLSPTSPGLPPGEARQKQRAGQPSWYGPHRWTFQSLNEGQTGSAAASRRYQSKRLRHHQPFLFFFFRSRDTCFDGKYGNNFHYNHFYFRTGHFRIFPPTFLPSFLPPLCVGTPCAADLTEGLSQVHSATRCWVEKGVNPHHCLLREFLFIESSQE